MSKAAATIGGTMVISVSAWILYDYKTCHPMRQMADSYNVSEGFVRLHNTWRCSTGIPPFATISLKDLAPYNGTFGKPTYFAADGYVYNVSKSTMFDSSYSLWKGKDATVALAKMSLQPQDVNRTDWDTLTDKEKESLQSWTHYFQQKYMIQGRLKEYDDDSKK